MWPEELAKKIIHQKGKNLVVATGITPSGPIHLGNLKEVMVGFLTANALLKEKARARLILLIDDFDPLRRLYPFLPEDFKKYIGVPLANIPDPEKCHQNYAEHFLADFLKGLKILKINPEILYAKKLYRTGVYGPLIKKILENQKEIIKILTTVSGRQIEKDWSPLMPLCTQCGRLTTTKILELKLKENKVVYECLCGARGEADFSRGEGKLTFRLQWPATWQIFSVSVEGFGKDHAASGGTYESAAAVARQIFKIEPPFPIPYEWVYVKGQGKMAGSTGVGFTPLEMLQIMPPKTLIYFYQRTKPNKHFDFDIAENLPALWNESGGLSGIPFEHLVTVAQSAFSQEAILDALRRTGYNDKIKNQESKIKTEIEYVKNWLKNYAPARYKFAVQKTLPKLKLSANQKEFLRQIYDIVKSQENWSGEGLHKEIHNLKNKMQIPPREAFAGIYEIFLGKDSGPQAGWLLASLDRKFVIKRLKDALK